MNRKHKRGMTLLELAIGTSLLAALTGGVLELMKQSSGAYNTGIAIVDLDTRNARVMDRMLRELSTASVGSINPADPAGGPFVEFMAPQGVTDGVIDWGPLIRYTTELAPGEALNDLDDNGDGLVDESVLVRIQDPDGPDELRIVLARGVAELLEGETLNGGDDNGNFLDDEGGFAVTIQNGLTATALTLRLTMQQVDQTGALFERTLTATVVLRNG